MNDEEELLTVTEVARILRCDQTTVRRWIQEGSLEAVTLPHSGKRRAYRIKRSVLNTVLRGEIRHASDSQQGRAVLRKDER